MCTQRRKLEQAELMLGQKYWDILLTRNAGCGCWISRQRLTMLTWTSLRRLGVKSTPTDTITDRRADKAETARSGYPDDPDPDDDVLPRIRSWEEDLADFFFDVPLSALRHKILVHVFIFAKNKFLRHSFRFVTLAFPSD